MSKPAKYVMGLLLLGALGGVAVLVLLMTGPRMQDQPSLKTFEWPMPPPPAGAVPVHAPVTVDAVADTTRSLASATPDEIELGRFGYQSYCVFCHGARGHGDGPVGLSFVPRPADLTSPGVRAMPDGELLRAMLRGEGHEPVLERVIAHDDWWNVAAYVRSLSFDNDTTATPSTQAASEP